MRAFIQNSLLNVAHWLGERGHDSASAGLYAALAEYEPDEPRNAYLRYRALLQEGRLDQALSQLEQVVTASPASAGTLHEYGVLLQRTKRHLDAVDAFDRALSIDVNQSECHAARGLSLMRLSRWTEAEAALRRAVRHDARNRLAWHDLGMTLAQLDRFDEAIAAFISALEIASDTASSMGLAYILESLERLPEAEKVLRDALHAEPGNVLVISTLAGVLVRQERAADASSLLVSANAQVPNHPAIVGALVWSLLGEDKPDEAIAAGQRLVSFDDTAYAHATLAWAYLQADQREAAVLAIDRAVARADAESDATISRADLDEIRGQVQSGR